MDSFSSPSIQHETAPEKSSQPPLLANRNTALTFGVEIEFCVASLDAGFEDPHPTAAPKCRELDAHLDRPYTPNKYPGSYELMMKTWFVQIQVAEALTTAGFSAITETEIDRMTTRYPVEERLKHWIVTDDPSLQEPRNDFKYHWYKIEINSPAYYFNPAALEQVKAVSAVLKQNFRMHVNGSMGLHVHAGDGRNGLEAGELRSLMATLFVFEPQLETLHPRHRIGHPYCGSLRRRSHISNQIVPHTRTNSTSKTRREFLEDLLQTTEQKDIIHTMSASLRGSKLAYNLSNMRPGSTASKQTIEFRQHESTLDGDRVENWIRTCVGLVEVPFRESRESIEALLRAHVDESVEEFDVIKVLLALNLTAEANFYDARFYALWVKNGKSLSVPPRRSRDSDSDTDDSACSLGS